jgi:hypothetical protein
VRRLVALAWLALASFVAACGPTAQTTEAPPSLATLAPPPTSTSPPAATPTSTAAVDIDPSLLDYLPTSVDGVAIVEAPEVEEPAVADPTLGDLAVGLAAGVAVVGEDWVIAVVVRLRPGAFAGEAFRDWRDSFDEGVCELAGGVSGHAETEIEGRTVYVGTCTGGVRTYHVLIEADGILISAQSLGERRLGEHLVETLRP